MPGWQAADVVDFAFFFGFGQREQGLAVGAEFQAAVAVLVGGQLGGFAAATGTL
jgi:hypothetical protein